MARKLNIPSAVLGTFVKLQQLSEDEFSSLYHALEIARPELHKGRLIEYVSRECPLGGSSAEILGLLVNLYTIRSANRVDLPEFVTDVKASLESGENSEVLASINWGLLVARLSALLLLDHSIGMTSKAREILWHNERIYCNKGTRIVSDIRPIFAINEPNTALGAVIVHTMNLRYHVGDETEDFYVALDTADLKELIDILKKEQEKAEALEGLIERANLAYLSPETH